MIDEISESKTVWDLVQNDIALKEQLGTQPNVGSEFAPLDKKSCLMALTTVVSDDARSKIEEQKYQSLQRAADFTSNVNSTLRSLTPAADQISDLDQLGSYSDILNISAQIFRTDEGSFDAAGFKAWTTSTLASYIPIDSSNKAVSIKMISSIKLLYGIVSKVFAAEFSTGNGLEKHLQSYITNLGNIKENSSKSSGIDIPRSTRYRDRMIELAEDVPNIIWGEDKNRKNSFFLNPDQITKLRDSIRVNYDGKELYSRSYMERQSIAELRRN